MYVCNFEFLFFMILADSDREFKWFQGFVNISIYQLLELELLRVSYLRVRKWEVRKWEVTPTYYYDILIIPLNLDRSNLEKWGHCDNTVRTEHSYALYVLYNLTYMYCTLYLLYKLYIVHTVQVPSFPVSDVEVSSSTSVQTMPDFIHFHNLVLSA